MTGDKHHIYDRTSSSNKGSQGLYNNDNDNIFDVGCCFHSVQTGFKLPGNLIKPTGKLHDAVTQF